MSEAEEKIMECIAEVEQYRYYSAEAEDGVRQLMEIQMILRNLNGENIEEALRKARQAYQVSLAYSSYVPKTVSNLKYIVEWLEKRKAGKV
ncbi:hypothetical protein KEJ18_07465 [Candidatus Bathyarchaeota archaeon]|nr:hypothetical protein [Candidatus Bathyarchaeota archaeon]